MIGIASLLAAFGALLAVDPTTLIAQAPLRVVFLALPYLPAKQFQPDSALNKRMTPTGFTPAEERALARGIAALLSERPELDPDWPGDVIEIHLTPPPSMPAGGSTRGAVVQVHEFHHKLKQLGLTNDQANRVIRHWSRAQASVLYGFIIDSLEHMDLADLLACIDVESTAMVVSGVLFRIRSDADRQLLVPFLVRRLADTKPLDRQSAADGLGSLGQIAVEAIPALHHVALNDPDRIVQMAASAAEHAIQRAAAER